MKSHLFAVALLLSLRPGSVPAAVLSTFTETRLASAEAVLPEPIRVDFRLAASPRAPAAPWPEQIFDDVAFTADTVGQTFRVTADTDPDFAAFAAALTDGVEGQVLRSFAAHTLTDPSRPFHTASGGMEESVFLYNRTLGPPVDLAGHRIDAATVRLDALAIQPGLPALGGLRYTVSYTVQFEGAALPEPAPLTPLLPALSLLLRPHRRAIPARTRWQSQPRHERSAAADRMAEPVQDTHESL